MKDMDKDVEILRKVYNNFKITGGSIFKQFVFNPATKSDSVEIGSNKKSCKRFEGAGGYPIAVVS